MFDPAGAEKQTQLAQKQLKLGSLFDGSGGFPLAGCIHGVTPAWASEIEPYPVRVTTARFPAMKRLGDVTKIDGAAIEPVDFITFGSPCQDLSVAGKQAGLHKGERSNLFFEAIRIIKEMREATDGIYPRIAVWENVPGAYSSNKGEDFRAVLQAFCTVKDETADVPRPAEGKWNRAGTIVGNGWSIAWRTFDAQFWGVPQRRKRIYLIADFGSECAGEILFEQEGLRGHSAESGAQRESPSANAQGSPRRSCNCLTPDDVQSRRVYTEDGTWPSLYGGEGGGHGYVLRQGAAGDAEGGPGGGVNPVLHMASGQSNAGIGVNVSCTLTNGKDRMPVCYESSKPPRRYIIRRLTPLECCRLQGFPDDWCSGLGTENPTDDEIAFWAEVWETHRRTMGRSGKAKSRKQIIKWLQNPHSDSAEYKMWGNGLALPNAAHVVGCAVKLIKETQA